MDETGDLAGKLFSDGVDEQRRAIADDDSAVAVRPGGEVERGTGQPFGDVAGDQFAVPAGVPLVNSGAEGPDLAMPHLESACTAYDDSAPQETVTASRPCRSILGRPLRINDLASESLLPNTLCLTWGAKPFLRTPPRPFVNASLRPQRAQLAVFSRLPRLCFARRVRLAPPICAPATFTGGRFLPVSERNQELVNSIARVVQPQAGRSETGRRT